MDRHSPPFGNSDTDIAIVGLAGRFAGARNVAQFWRNLRDGIESISRFDAKQLEASGVDPRLIRDPEYVPTGFVLDGMEMFDPSFFGLTPKEGAIMDPQHRLFLECSWEALELAGHLPDRFAGAIGVYAGCGMGTYLINNILTNPELVQSDGMFLLRHTGNDKDFLATRVSYALNLTGPSISVQTACSTSLVAIHLAVQSLLAGECDMALAGGSTVEQPHRVGYRFEKGGVRSPDGHCRAFDADSQGTAFGSGVGVVALRRLGDAIGDGDFVHAVIKGSAVNNDGSGKVGYFAPSVDRQAAAAAEAIAVSGVDPATITYMEAHGTGTPVGDPIEVQALTQAFRTGTARNGFCAIGSVKTNIAHTDTAAGVASVIKVTEALKHRQIPPSLNYSRPNPSINFGSTPFFVNAELRDWVPAAEAPRRAAVNSLGVGGTNAHLVMEEAPQRQSSGPSRESQLLLISARTPSSLERATEGLAEHLRGEASVNLADVAHTLRVGRKAFAHRRYVVATDAADAATRLETADAKAAPTREADDTPPAVAFSFSGGGAQYPGMGAELYRTERVYREAVDECLALLRRHVDFDLRPLLFVVPGSEEEAAAALERPTRALPALFVTQYALAKLWMSWGIEPDALIGHSMGEYTAAHLAGVFSLDDGLALVSLRGRLFETVPEGGMLSIPLSAEAVEPLLREDLSLAAVNAPELCVVSGPTHAIDALAEQLQLREIDCRRVRINIAAHSAMLDSILRPFHEFFAGISLHAPRLPFVSNVTGDWITAAEATDPGYWVRHLRGTVRFADGISRLLQKPGRVILEVGPGRVLTTLARLHPQMGPGHAALQSMRHPGEEGSDLAHALDALGRLWLHGVDPDWIAFRSDELRHRVPLPTYPFDRQRCWFEPGKRLAPGEDDGAPHKRPDVAEWFYQASWKRSVPISVPEMGEGTEQILMFHDETGLGGRLADRLGALGHAVVAVHVGKRFERRGPDAFVLNPASASDFDALLTALVAEARLPRRIAYLWPVAESETSLESLSEEEIRSFYALLFLAQAIGRADISDPISLRVISSGLHQVAGEANLSPAKALLVGPCRVIPRELSNVECRAVDVVLPARSARAETRVVDQIVAELFAPSPDEVVAYRGPDRWVQSYEPARLPAPPEARIRSGGTYLITGGLGGIALEVAEEFARSGPVNLVLLARSGLPERSMWGAWIEKHGEEDRTSRRIRKVEAIETLGARVLLATADVTDLAAMEAVMRDVRARFGAVNGVVHAAGVLDDALILLKEPVAAARVLAPKVRGTLVLDRILGEDPLDFFVLFSSRSSLSGLVGQVDYAAANAFLDAFAHYRTALVGEPTVAVNWSAWAEVGMVAEMVRGSGPESSAPVPHPLLDRCVPAGAGEEVFATDFSLGRNWVLDDHRLRGGAALIPGTGYLELVRAAYTQRPRPGAIEFSDVVFLSPFVVHPEEQKQLRVELRGNGDGHDFAIRGRNGAGWHEHVSGVVTSRSAPPPQNRSLDAIRTRCALRVEERASLEHAHLDLGSRWECLRRIEWGADEALATLELPEEFAGDLDVYGLHPALLDVATGFAQPLIPQFDPQQDFFVPASYTRVVAHAPMPRHAYSHVRYRPSGDEDMAVFDVTIFDPSGAVAVEVSEFVMMRVRDRLALDATRTPASGYADAEEDASPVGTLAVDLDDAILPGEGMAALRSILAAGPISQVVVSPEELPRWIEHLRRQAEPKRQRGESPPETPLEPVPEVEEVLSAHEAVGEVVVLARPDRQAIRLVAYVVHREGEYATASELRRFLRKRLAEEQVPQNFVEMDVLPRAADGGVDLRALPDPFAAADDYVAPRTDAERVIAAIWQELLGVDRVSIHDNFLDVGGHSLLVLRAVTRTAKQTGVRLSPLAFNLQTLEQIAAQCAAEMPATPEAQPIVVDALAGRICSPDAEPTRDSQPEPDGRSSGHLASRLLDAVRQTLTRA